MTTPPTPKKKVYLETTRINDISSKKNSDLFANAMQMFIKDMISSYVKSNFTQDNIEIAWQMSRFHQMSFHINVFVKNKVLNDANDFIAIIIYMQRLMDLQGEHFISSFEEILLLAVFFQHTYYNDYVLSYRDIIACFNISLPQFINMVNNVFIDLEFEVYISQDEYEACLKQIIDEVYAEKDKALVFALTTGCTAILEYMVLNTCKNIQYYFGTPQKKAEGKTCFDQLHRACTLIIKEKGSKYPTTFATLVEKIAQALSLAFKAINKTAEFNIDTCLGLYNHQDEFIMTVKKTFEIAAQEDNPGLAACVIQQLGSLISQYYPPRPTDKIDAMQTDNAAPENISLTTDPSFVTNIKKIVTPRSENCFAPSIFSTSNFSNTP